MFSELSPEAQELQAVNTVVRKGDSLIGYNTDVIGFDKTISGLSFGKKGCLVLGTGGASKAVVYVLQQRNLPFKRVSRTKSIGGLTYDNINAEVLRQFPGNHQYNAFGYDESDERKTDATVSAYWCGSCTH